MAKQKRPYSGQEFFTVHAPSGIAFSTGNSKMGPVASISQEPVRTCPYNAPCFGKCYAIYNMIQPHPKSICTSYNRNTNLYHEMGAEKYANDIINMIRLYGWVRFRWHVAGDMIDEEYAQMMIDIAKACPDTEFFAFTKKYKLAAGMKDLPKNLSMVLSVWGDFKPSDELCERFPLAYIRDKEGLFEVPDDAFDCNDDCTRCMRCFHLVPGQSIVFNEH